MSKEVHICRLSLLCVSAVISRSYRTTTSASSSRTRVFLLTNYNNVVSMFFVVLFYKYFTYSLYDSDYIINCCMLAAVAHIYAVQIYANGSIDAIYNKHSNFPRPHIEIYEWD